MTLSDIAGLVGAAAGVLGLGVAGWALYYGKDSRDIAKAGSADAETAIDLAKKSNVIAEEAKQAADDANTISLRAEQRDTERHDADWDLDRGEPGEYILTNTGTSDAHRVRLRVTVDSGEATQTYDLVRGGRSVTISVPEAAAEFQREQMEVIRAKRRAREEERQRRAQPFPSPSLGFDVGMNSLRIGFQMHHVGYRVDWETALGTHRDKSDAYQSSLGDHDV